MLAAASPCPNQAVGTTASTTAPLAHGPFGIRHLCFVIPRPMAAAAPVVLFTCPVESGASTTTAVSPAKDITFACSHCSSPLVVDVAAAGMTLPCQKCGKPTVVPAVPAVGMSRGTLLAEPNNKVAELRRQLKENESQRTEVTGYINQLSIQLHRWQLRLQTLEERRKQLENDRVGAR